MLIFTVFLTTFSALLKAAMAALGVALGFAFFILLVGWVAWTALGTLKTRRAA